MVVAQIKSGWVWQPRSRSDARSTTRPSQPSTSSSSYHPPVSPIRRSPRKVRELFRRHSIWFESILSLLVGVAKEFADELGFFRSTTNGAKDTVADFMGVLIGSLLLYFVKYVTRPEKETGQIREVSMISKGAACSGFDCFFFLAEEHRVEAVGERSAEEGAAESVITVGSPRPPRQHKAALPSAKDIHRISIHYFRLHLNILIEVPARFLGLLHHAVRHINTSSWTNSSTSLVGSRLQVGR
ncbi:hypothetical protein ACFX15_029953 [Malus domestica]